MPGAMNEVVAVSLCLDVAPRGAIHLPAGNAASGADRIQYDLHAGVARVANDAKNLTHAVRRCLAHKAGPGYVVINCARSIFLRPNIEQNEVALANRRGAPRLRFVMRITAVSVHRHDRWIIRHQILAAKRFHEPLLNFMLAGAHVTHTSSNFLESPGSDGVNRVAYGKVAVRSQHRLQVVE